MLLRNFSEKKKTFDYNEKEEEVINYLVDTDFKNKNLIGIQLLIPNQDNVIQQLKELNLKDEEIKNFFDLIGNSNNDFKIMNLERLNFFIPSLHIPEYMTFIIIKTDENWIYLDYENKSAFILSNKKQINFLDVYNGNWTYFSISFVNKNLSKEFSN